MGSVPFAFSVHHFINSVGADAGFAAIIGLAILILLYFAQARETASLREQIYEWAQRVQQLEARVTQLSRQQASVSTASEPVPSQTIAGDTRAVPAAAGAAAAATAATAAPAKHAPALAGAPAGVAAPALTAATKLIPTYADVAPKPAAASGGPGPVSAGQLPPDATAVVAPPPPPATVAGGANGSSQEHDPTPPPSFPQGQPRGAAGAMPPPPRVQLRQPTPPPGRKGATPPRNQPPRPQRTRGRRGLLLILAALVAVAIVAVVFVLTSGGGASHKQANAGATASNVSSARHRTATGAAPGAAPVTPSAVTVAVLNGTVTQGLAGRISQKLITEGYKKGRVTTAADQTRTATEVAYMPGQRRDALLVAKSLNLGPASVQPVDQSTQALACPPALGACTATVVVTLGTDLSNIQ
jgi:hypothetical protein